MVRWSRCGESFEKVPYHNFDWRWSGGVWILIWRESWREINFLFVKVCDAEDSWRGMKQTTLVLIEIGAKVEAVQHELCLDITDFNLKYIIEIHCSFIFVLIHWRVRCFQLQSIMIQSSLIDTPYKVVFKKYIFHCWPLWPGKYISSSPTGTTTSLGMTWHWLLGHTDVPALISKDGKYMSIRLSWQYK